ncbi:MAG: 2-hydroxyacid dehydrogenase [Chloroflexota bacterium]
MPKVVYFATVPDDVRDIVAAEVPAGWEFTVLEPGSPAEKTAKFSEADFVLVSTEKITEPMLANAPRLKLIQHQGVGYDNIDVAAAARHGIPVALTPEGTSVGVAEHTFLLILALYKQLLLAHRSLLEGKWLIWDLRPSSYEIHGKQLGLIGFGRIGQEVTKRAVAFGASIAYYDVVPAAAETELRYGAKPLPLDELLRTSDIVSVHVPRTPQTVGLIGAHELGLMKPTAVLINTARGGLVDEAALYRALKERRIAGAGLDVFSKEPPPADDPLFTLDNVVVTPHISAGTRDALITKMKAAFSNMVRVHRGEEPINRVLA